MINIFFLIINSTCDKQVWKFRISIHYNKPVTMYSTRQAGTTLQR